PPGMVLVVPGDLEAFMASDLLSPEGRARVAAEAELGPEVGMPEPGGDVSMGQLFRARFGDEMVEVLVAPILAGIYSGDIDQLSLMATFPRFVEMVRKHGSLLAGAAATLAGRDGPSASPFRSLRRGVGQLIPQLLVATQPFLDIRTST